MNSYERYRSSTKLNRRSFVRLLGGAAVGVPIAAWATLPNLSAARTHTDTTSATTWWHLRWKQTTPTPTPSPTPSPTASASAQDTSVHLAVTSLGAKGDGRADDTAAIQAAINEASKSGATVFVPSGTYVITKTLSISAPVIISGQSMTDSKIVAVSGFHLFDITNTTGVTISNLTLRGANASGGTGYGVRTSGVRNLTVANCILTNIPDTGISLSDVSQSSISGCQFIGIGRSGIRFQDPGNGKGNSYVSVVGNAFKQTNLTATSGHAAVQTQGGQVIHSFLTIADNHVEPVGVGLGLDSLDNSVVNNNQIVGDPDHGGEGIAFTGSNNQITNNEVSNCGAAGILEWCVGYRRNEKNVITGNTCWNNFGQGIAVVCADPGTVLDSLTIRGNRCYSQSATHPQAIGVQSYNQGTTSYSWVNVAISNNDLRGNTERGIDLIPPSVATLSGNLI